MIIKDLMDKKIVKAKEDSSIEDAIRSLYKRRVGSVIVVNEKGECVGIFTNTDALRVIVKKIPLESQIKRVMSKKVITVSETSTFSKAKALMNRFRVRHLPVTNKKGKLVGILTMRSILDEIIGLQKHKT